MVKLCACILINKTLAVVASRGNIGCYCMRCIFPIYVYKGAKLSIKGIGRLDTTEDDRADNCSYIHGCRPILLCSATVRVLLQ